MVTVVDPPLQDMEPSVFDAVNAAGSLIVPLTVTEHEFASVTVKLYGPADTVCAPSLLYGVVPPDAVIVTTVDPPLQDMESSVFDADNTVGSVIVPVTVSEQEFASVTVKLYGPADTVCAPSLL